MRFFKNMTIVILSIVYFIIATGFKTPQTVENAENISDFKIPYKIESPDFEPLNKEESSDFKSPQATEKTEKNDYIKWVDFNAPHPLLKRLYQLDVKYHNTEVAFDFCEVLSYLSVKNGNSFNTKKDNKNLSNLLSRLQNGEKTADIISGKYYDYFLECYRTIFKGFFGEYTIEEKKATDNSNNKSAYQNTHSYSGQNQISNQAEANSHTNFVKTQNISGGQANSKINFSQTRGGQGEYGIQNVQTKSKYGLVAYYPFAYGYWCNHYDDFGNSRSYGYKRRHLGHDMFGATGTPIVAIEGGTVKELGWNRYGGWRAGILSNDGKRYYYYAHLRKDHPFADGLTLGGTVAAGEVIGYLGRTGYSNTENVNLKTGKPHLHVGLQLIFDDSQIKGNKEIWIDLYGIINLLSQNKASAAYDKSTKEFKSIHLRKLLTPAAEQKENNKKNAHYKPKNDLFAGQNDFLSIRRKENNSAKKR